jgi:hypothetical protein
MNTFRTTSPSFHSQHSPPHPSCGSLTHPFGTPIFSFNARNLSLPITLPFGSTTGSSSM